jgi:hypothetical protein
MSKNAITFGVERTGYADPFGDEKRVGEGEEGIADEIAQKGQDILRTVR